MTGAGVFISGKRKAPGREEVAGRLDRRPGRRSERRIRICWPSFRPVIGLLCIRQQSLTHPAHSSFHYLPMGRPTETLASLPIRAKLATVPISPIVTDNRWQLAPRLPRCPFGRIWSRPKPLGSEPGIFKRALGPAPAWSHIQHANKSPEPRPVALLMLR